MINIWGRGFFENTFLKWERFFYGGVEMEGRTMGFAVWCGVGGIILCLAVYACFAKRPVGFWANVKAPEVTDVRRYNRAVAKLFGILGMVTIGLGFPLLAGQNSAWVLISVVGVMAESIAAMAVYSLVIEKKYRK